MFSAYVNNISLRWRDKNGSVPTSITFCSFLNIREYAIIPLFLNKLEGIYLQKI